MLETPKSFQGYDIETRDCRFDSELSELDTLFPVYDPSLCQYACSLLETEAQGEFDCVPWDIVYPHKYGQTRICSGEQARRFKEQLEKRIVNESCVECRVPRCKSFSYSAMVS